MAFFEFKYSTNYFSFQGSISDVVRSDLRISFKVRKNGVGSPRETFAIFLALVRDLNFDNMLLRSYGNYGRYVIGALFDIPRCAPSCGTET